MGSQTVAKVGSANAVNKDLAELRKLSDDPVNNLERMNAILVRLASTHITIPQRNKLAAVEKNVYEKLDPTQRRALYDLSSAKGYVAVDMSRIKELQDATWTLREFSKTPLMYQLEVQALYHKFGDELKGTKIAKDINRQLTPTELAFVNSAPLVVPKPEKQAPNLKPSAEKPPVEKPSAPSEEDEHEISSTDAKGEAEIERGSASARAKTRHTEINLLPSPERAVGTSVKTPNIVPSTALNSMLGNQNVATLVSSGGQMWLGYFQPTRNSTAGTTYYTVIINWANNATGQSGDLNPANANDPRWNLISQLTGINAGTQTGRQATVDTLNAFRRGNYLEGLNMLPDGSRLKGFIFDSIKQTCPQMLTSIPIEIATMGGDLELFKFKGGKLTLGPNAWLSHITSQQYQPDLKASTDASGNTVYSLRMIPTGYTGKQMAVRLGGTAKYHPWEYATVQLDIGALSQYDVVQSGDASGQGQLIALGKTQGLFEASFVDQSGRTAGYLKLPLYYALRGTLLTPSNSFSLTGAAGLGLGSLKGMPIMLVADIGGELKPGSSDYPQSISSLIWRAGIGITPSTKSGHDFPMKFYYVQSSGGEPTPLGIKTESTIGGGADLKIYGVRVGTEVRYRTVEAISGLPITGPGNVLVIFNLNVSDLLNQKR